MRPKSPPTINPIAEPISPYVTNHHTIYGKPHASAVAPVTGSLLSPCCKNIADKGILKKNVAIGADILGNIFE
jgi:hypothetical protein